MIHNMLSPIAYIAIIALDDTFLILIMMLCVMSQTITEYRFLSGPLPTDLRGEACGTGYWRLPNTRWERNQRTRLDQTRLTMPKLTRGQADDFHGDEARSACRPNPKSHNAAARFIGHTAERSAVPTGSMEWQLKRLSARRMEIETS